MGREDLSVTEREIRRRRSSLIMKSLIALLILVLAGLAALPEPGRRSRRSG